MIPVIFPLTNLAKTFSHRIKYKNWYGGKPLWVKREFGTWLYAKSENLIDAYLFNEPRTWNYVKKCVVGGTVATMLDVGANIGGYSVVLGKKIQVVSMEPVPDTYSILNLNMRLNKSNVAPIRAAAYDGDVHMVRIKRSRSHSGANAITPDGTIEAPTCTLDEICGKFGPFDLIKIDVEGAEVRVLKGLSTMPKRLVIEVQKKTWNDVKRRLMDERMEILFIEKLIHGGGSWNIVARKQ